MFFFHSSWAIKYWKNVSVGGLFLRFWAIEASDTRKFFFTFIFSQNKNWVSLTIQNSSEISNFKIFLFRDEDQNKAEKKPDFVGQLSCPGKPLLVHFQAITRGWRIFFPQKKSKFRKKQTQKSSFDPTMPNSLGKHNFVRKKKVVF